MSRADFHSTRASSVSIIGCGYLGLPLARHLVADGLRVLGSTTKPEKLWILEAAGIEAARFVMHQPVSGGAPLVDADVVVVNIPPGRRDPARLGRYAEGIHGLESQIPAEAHVVFASSTSVYPDAGGEVDLDDAAPHSDGARALLDAEGVFRKRGRSTIVRFGGLYGYDRRPGRFFAGRQDVKGGSHPVNMIHRDDAVALLRSVILNPLDGEILNACAPRHPVRSEFYATWAQRDGLHAPSWSATRGGGKRVRTRIPTSLGFAFSYPDPMLPAP